MSVQDNSWNNPSGSPRYTERNVRGTPANDATRLLGVYPFASITPSTHVAQHLSHLTLTGSPSASQFYASFNMPPEPYVPAPLLDFTHEANILAQPQVPQNIQDREFWEASRQETLALMQDRHPVAPNPPPHSWNLSSPPSNYTTPPFVQTLFNHAAPYHAYPTPPPAMNTPSSSLANALGEGFFTKSQTHKSEDSKAFFNNFLKDTVEKMDRRPDIKESSAPSTPAIAQSSPDPLSLRPSSPFTPASSSVAGASPKKRRTVEVLIETPRKKNKAPQMVSSKDEITPFKLQTPNRNMVPYIEVTTPQSMASFTPTPVRTRDGRNFPNGFELKTDDAFFSSPGVKSSGKRTGGRDERVPLEKLTALFDEILEAEDNFIPNVDSADTADDILCHNTSDSTQPFLQANIIRKVTKLVSQISRPTKRVRLEGNAASPRRVSGLAEVDVNTLSRILKLLERSVKAGEYVDPFASHSRKEETVTKLSSPKKKDKSKGATPEVNSQVSPSKGAKRDSSLLEPINDLTQQDFNDLHQVLITAHDSVLAADCCIALLSGDRLSKQLYSEDLIASCLAATKNQLTTLIYPFVEERSNDSNVSSLLQHLIKRRSSSIDTAPHHQIISQTFQVLCSLLGRITALLCAEHISMSDTIIIQAAYIAIGPFFVVESDEGEGRTKKGPSIVASTLGNTALRGLRLQALSLIRSVFASHEDQRSWIIEEILSSLIKLSDSKQKAGLFRLRDGRSIRTVSALLLQLVQTSVHDVRVEASRIARSRQHSLALHRADSFEGDKEQPFLTEHDKEEIRLLSSGLEAPTKVAKTILLFLTQRSGKAKSTKNTNEAEYRAIFDNLVSDILVVLFWPEWPAASLMLGITCKFMLSSLDDVKSSAQNDNNAFRSLALDHLGVIAGCLRTKVLKLGGVANTENENLKALDDVLQSANSKQLTHLVSTHHEISTYLSRRSTEDQAYESARELATVAWGQELASALNQCARLISDDSEDSDLGIKRSSIVKIGAQIRTTFRELWKEAPTDIFDDATQEEVSRMDKLAEELAATHSLKNAFDPILNVILSALDAPPVFMRTKALKALSQVLTVDSTILTNKSVRNAIESHLLDSSPAVRDAAVELIGKYMVDKPGVAGDYYEKIAERIADTGVGVRKRVVKLLKSCYSITDNLERKIDICTRLVLRMLDEDTSIKELATKSLEELWFPPYVQPSQRLMNGATSDALQQKSQLLMRVSVIMGVAGNFKDRLSPLEDLLRTILSATEETGQSGVLTQYVELCDTMIDGLVDASDFPGFTISNCIKTIYLLTCAYPAVISASKASTLLPYLRNSATPEEHLTSEYILKICRASIPHMPKTAIKFGSELQKVLQPMVVKPSASAGLPALQESVACFCSVILNLTHDFLRLVTLFKSCLSRIEHFIKQPMGGNRNPQDLRALTMLVYIVSLLGEHAELDRIKEQHQGAGRELSSLSSGSMVKYVYDILLRLYDRYLDPSFRGRLLQCLGFLFKAQPTLMTLETSASIMDTIFASPEEENRTRLLRLLQEFLASEASKHALQEKESAKVKVSGGKINMEELVGNTHGFADSGVSSAIIQRYLTRIHDVALTPHSPAQVTAVDILSFTIKQGLAHPIQSLPVIVALETSSISSLSARGNSLHAILQSKHANLLNTGYLKAARASFEYQQLESKGRVQGYRLQPSPVALLHRWYILIREKRPTRQEFLKAILKIFEVEFTTSISRDDIDFVRYISENISMLEYKTQEEVLTIIRQLTTVLSTTGLQLVELLYPSHLRTELGAPLTAEAHTEAELTSQIDNAVRAARPIIANVNAASKGDDYPNLVQASIIVGIVVLLRAYLKSTYGLSEEKCSKWVSGKKSAFGDRPAVRKTDSALLWDRMTFAVTPLQSEEQTDLHKQEFLRLWTEDGGHLEPEEEWE